MSFSYLNFLRKAHRWLALLLAPVFLLVLVSGAILAFKPILADTSTGTLDVPALIAALDKVDPQGQASGLAIASDGRHFELRSRGAGPSGTFEIASASQSAASGFDFFGFALNLHKNLAIGAGVLVEIAAFAMVFIILSGLFFGLPRLRNTLAGWHLGLGWLGLPLMLVTPLTGVLMALHLGMPSLPRFEAADHALPLARSIEIAAQQADLSKLTMARGFRRGATLLSVQTSAGSALHLVSGTGKLSTSTEGPGWVRMLHEGSWAGAWSGLVNLLSALGLIGLLGTGVWAWWQRRRQASLRSHASGKPAETTLVAFASQTGTAARLAEATANALRQAGESVMLASLAALQPVEMAGFRRTLLIASTTGDGELPDQAQAFVQGLRNTPMQGSRFSLFALGDTRYARFCAGGLKLRTALLAQGAQEFLPAETADGEATSRSWQAWLQRVAKTLALPEITAGKVALDQDLSLQLVARTRLDNPLEADLKPAWQLRFRAQNAAEQFRPGDLLLIRPTPEAAPRCYSIGSSSQAGNALIDLTVVLHGHTAPDGQHVTGLASSYLGRQLEIGTQIEAQLRRHPGFNPPADASQPLILIAAGAGVAPFPGFLAERRKQPGAAPVWLLFGNRKRAGDFYYRSYFEECLAQGVLSRLDTAFSRDAGSSSRLPQCIVEQGVELLRWMNERNAAVYLCGGATTLGQTVRTSFLELLAQHPVAGETPEATLARWQAEGRWRQDLFT